MLFLLGTITDENFDKGIMTPERILFRRNNPSGRFSQYVYIRPETYGNVNQKRNLLPAVLSGNPYAMKPLIEFLSYYRGRKDPPKEKQKKDYFKLHRVKKTYIFGKLCAFECNAFGEMTGKVVFLKKVPEINGYNRDKSKYILQDYFDEQQKDILGLFYKDEDSYFPLEESNIAYPNKPEKPAPVKYKSKKDFDPKYRRKKKEKSES